MYKTKNEQDVYIDVLRLKSLGMTTRQIASYYDKDVITCADISRIATHRLFPRGSEKRKALSLPLVCLACHQRMPKPKPPEWVIIAADWLQAREK